jgi:hypothetical protein
MGECVLRWGARSTLEVDSRLLVIHRLLQDFFLRIRQSLDEILEVDSPVNFWNHSRQDGQLSREKSTVAGSRIGHEVVCWLCRTFLKILKPFCTNSFTFPLKSDEKSTAKSTKNRQSTTCNSCDFFFEISTVDSPVNFWKHSRQYGQLLKP